MTFLTLTTDFGQSSFSLASFKGLLYSQCNTLQIVDISHDTIPFDMEQASFQLKNCWQDFPKNTLHILRVGESQARRNRFIAFERDNHFFLMPDAGLISLVFEAPPREVVLVQNEQKNIRTSLFLSKIAQHILKTNSLNGLGDSTSNYKEVRLRNPTISTSYIRGEVSFIDRYGNATTNISKQLFDRQSNQREFQIELPAAIFRKLSQNYQDVSSGDIICKFNSEGLLQLSIKDGSAKELLGLYYGSRIQIDFL